MIEQFCDEHHTYNAISPKRAYDQRRTLRRFEKWLGAPAETTTPEQFQGWLSFLLDEGLKPASVVTLARMVRPFFEWAWQREALDADRFLRLKAVPMPRTPKPMPRPYNRKELLQFWAELEAKYPPVKPLFWQRWESGRSKWARVWTEAMNVQIKAIVALALDCGLRQHEIFEASLDDIHYDNQYVVVREGKGDKYREVPHTDASRAAIYAWLEMRTRVGASHDRPWLVLSPYVSPNGSIPSTPTNPMNPWRFSALMRSVGAWELHRFRHTCGTEWLRARVPLHVVQRLLGHSTIAMTQRYTEIVKTDVHDAVERAQAQFARAVRPAA